MPEFLLVFRQQFFVMSEIRVTAADVADAERMAREIAPRTEVQHGEVGSVMAGRPDLVHLEALGVTATGPTAAAQREDDRAGTGVNFEDAMTAAGVRTVFVDETFDFSTLKLEE